MTPYQYKVVPAPTKGERIKGAKTLPDRFAQAMMTLMNDLGREGWEYLRADALPCEERVGFTGRSTTMVNILIFRRPAPHMHGTTALPDTQIPDTPDAGGRRSGFPFGLRAVKPVEPPRIALVSPTPPHGSPAVGPATGPFPGNGSAKP